MRHPWAGKKLTICFAAMQTVLMLNLRAQRSKRSSRLGPRRSMTRTLWRPSCPKWWTWGTPAVERGRGGMCINIAADANGAKTAGSHTGAVQSSVRSIFISELRSFRLPRFLWARASQSWLLQRDRRTPVWHRKVLGTYKFDRNRGVGKNVDALATTDGVRQLSTNRERIFTKF